MRIDELLYDQPKDHFEYDYSILTTIELKKLIKMLRKMEGPNAEDLSNKSTEELQEIVDNGPDNSPSWLELETDRLTYPEQRELKRLHNKALVEIHRNQ